MAHWTECDELPWWRRDRPKESGAGWEMEKSEEVVVFVCVFKTLPLGPPGCRGLTAEWADWHIDNTLQSSSLLISPLFFLLSHVVMLMIRSAPGLLQLHKQVDGALSCNLGIIQHARFNEKKRCTETQSVFGGNHLWEWHTWPQFCSMHNQNAVHHTIPAPASAQRCVTVKATCQIWTVAFPSTAFRSIHAYLPHHIFSQYMPLLVISGRAQVVLGWDKITTSPPKIHFLLLLLIDWH